MSDWTTARVVRDRDGDMWGREREGWNLISAETATDEPSTADLLAEQFGPLVPVLDADGLPVVRTVGDLTARHIGKRVRLWPGTADGEVPVTITRVKHYPFGTNIADDMGHPPHNTPCELLPEVTPR